MNPSSDPKQRERALSRMASILFDKAAKTGHWVTGLELFSGVIMALPAVFHATPEIELPFEFAGVALLGFSRWLKSISENSFGSAESIRREALFSDALGWGISPMEFERLRELATPKIVRAAEANPRETDFFASTTPPGTIRLAEMTAESAFWTRHLYRIQLRRLTTLFAIVYSVLLVAIVVPSLHSAAFELLTLRRSIYLFLPVFIGIDFIGRRSRLQTIIADIYRVECSLERLIESENTDSNAIMQLVMEYNCLVAGGLSTTNKFYLKHRSDIQKDWDETHAS